MLRPYLKHFPKIGENTYIDPQSAVIGNVVIGKDSSIWPFACIRGDVQAITIGSRTSIQDGCVLHVTHDSQYHPGGFPLHVGDDVTVGHKATLHACTILDACIIGMDSIILDGAIIESDTILGAGTLVPPGKKLPSGFLWVGSPCVQKRPLTPEEIAFIRYSAQNYVKLKNDYLAQNQK
jgi:carbonic anhydrase/acetyltransferase-like protein (isoleucine patch superfamily)